MPTDRRTLTNQPDPHGDPKAKRKRIPTQIHRRTRSNEPLAEQWDSGSGSPPADLKMPSGKMRRQAHSDDEPSPA